VEHYQGKMHLSPSGIASSNEQLPIMRLYGVNSSQNSVLLHVHGFLPYLYIPAPEGMQKDDLEEVENSLMVEVFATLYLTLYRL